MGFAVRWGGYRAVLAVVIENGIRFAVPIAVYAAYKIGYKIGEATNDFLIEQFSLDEMEEHLGPGPDLLESIN